MGCGCGSLSAAKAAQVHPAAAEAAAAVVPGAPSVRAPAEAAAGGSASSSARPHQQQADAPTRQEDLPDPAAPSSGPPKPRQTLIKAVKEGNLTLIEELLKAGGDIEELGMWDNTPLLAACAYGQSEAALRLIAHKANVLAKNEHDATPMHYAAVEGSSAVVEALIAAARAQGGADLVARLVDCGDAKVYNRHLNAYARRTPLASAAESGFAALVGTLAGAGAAVEAHGEDGRTPMWLACRHSRLAAAKLLLQLGAHTNVKDTQGVSVLGAAMLQCNEDLALALLKHGIGDVNDTAGLPLRDAVKAGKRAVVEALLTHGAALQEPGGSGSTTALHAACEKGDEYLVTLLVRARADPSWVDATGLTPFDLLRRRGLTDGHIVALLSPPAAAAQDGSTGATNDVDKGEEAQQVE